MTRPATPPAVDLADWQRHFADNFELFFSGTQHEGIEIASTLRANAAELRELRAALAERNPSLAREAQKSPANNLPPDAI